MAANRLATLRHCARCNRELPAHATYCPACGQRHPGLPDVARQCRNPRCRRLHSRHVRYCTSCGDPTARRG